VKELAETIALGTGEEDILLTDYLKLIFAGQLLDPGNTLASLGLTDDSEIEVIRLRDPRLQKLVVDKSDRSMLGLDVEVDETIRIEHISDDGLVHKWNEQNPEQAIKAGDEIVKVNGIPNMVI